MESIYYASRINPEQKLLINSILSPLEIAKENWQEWKSKYILDDIWSVHTERMLPAVYLAIANIEENIELLNKLHGIYAKSWYRNQILLNNLKKVIQLYNSHGIPTIALKEAGHLLLKPKHQGARKILNVGLLVPPSYYQQASKLLIEEMNFHKKFEREHLTNFVISEGLELALHRYLFNFYYHDVDIFWKRATEINIEEVHTKVMNPTDQFLHVCENANWVWEKSLYWIMDAVSISGKANINWQQFVDSVEYLKMRKLIWPAISILKENKFIDIPDSVVDTLSLKNCSLIEKTEFLLEHKRVPILGHLARYWRHRWKEESFSTPFLGFFRFLKWSWGISSWNSFCKIFLIKVFTHPLRFAKRIILRKFHHSNIIDLNL